MTASVQVFVKRLEVLEGDFPDLFKLGFFRNLAIGCGDRIDQLLDGCCGIGVPTGELVVQQSVLQHAESIWAVLVGAGKQSCADLR